MRYLFRFICACIYAVWKPSAHFTGNVLLFIWHGTLPKLSARKLIKLEWETSYFYCNYLFMNDVTPEYVYKCFKDYVISKRTYIPNVTTVFEYQHKALGNIREW
jgi:hypothetical protein